MKYLTVNTYYEPLVPADQVNRVLQGDRTTLTETGDMAEYQLMLINWAESEFIPLIPTSYDQAVVLENGNFVITLTWNTLEAAQLWAEQVQVARSSNLISSTVQEVDI
jgi:hypothetical protein